MLVRLEVDAGRMTLIWPNGMSGWHTTLILLVEFGAGTALGLLYFRGLRWNARLFAGGASLGLTIGLGIARFACLAAILMLASRAGAMPLLVVVLGVLAGRAAIMRSVKRLAA